MIHDFDVYIGSKAVYSVAGGTSGKDFRSDCNDWEGTWLEAFQSWADEALPVEDPFAGMIKRDDAGCPLFPSGINVMESSVKDLQALAKVFFEALYSM